MDNSNQTRAAVEWLTTVLAAVAAAGLCFVYILWQPAADNRVGQLIIQAIPSALVALTAIVIIYFIFTRRGLRQRDLGALDLSVQDIAEQVARRIAPNGEVMHPEVVSFHETFRHVNWEGLLRDANTTIDIVVYYFDSWVNANYDALRAYFTKPGSRMRVFVADPTDEFILGNVARLFPEYSVDVVREKVTRTGRRLLQALREAGGDPARLEFLYVPHLLSYSAQCFDGRVLVLSVFEMFRKSRIDSPAIVLDMSKSEHLAKYWHKEIEGLRSESKLVEDSS